MLRPPDRDDVAHIGAQFPPGVFQSKHILNPNKEATDLDSLSHEVSPPPRRSSAKRKDIARFRTYLLLEPNPSCRCGNLPGSHSRESARPVDAGGLFVFVWFA